MMRDENCFNLGLANGFSGLDQRNLDNQVSEFGNFFDKGCLIEKVHQQKFGLQSRSQEYDMTSTGCVQSSSGSHNSTKSIHCFSKGN